MMCIDSIQVSLTFNIVDLLKLWVNIVAHPHTIHHLGMNIYHKLWISIFTNVYDL